MFIPADLLSLSAKDPAASADALLRHVIARSLACGGSVLAVTPVGPYVVAMRDLRADRVGDISALWAAQASALEGGLTVSSRRDFLAPLMAEGTLKGLLFLDAP